MASLAVFSLVALGCGETPEFGEIVANHAVVMFDDARNLTGNCVPRGRITATEVSTYAFHFLYSYEDAEAMAIGKLGNEAARLGANTVVLDREAIAEIMPVDNSREHGVRAEGDAYQCDEPLPK